MNFLYPLLVVLLAVFAVAPLEYPGAFQSHTGLLAVYNLISLDQNPWQFLTWAPTVGNAYDLFRSDGALPYYIAEVIHLVGFSYLDAVKLVYALAWLTSGLAMFALARRYLSQAAALLCSIAYIYLPYHIAAIYVRGAFAESVAWALLPLALLTVERVRSDSSLLHTDSGESRPPTADGQSLSRRSLFTFGLCLLPFTLLFLTQPGIAILFSLVAYALAAIRGPREQERMGTVAGIILGGLLLGGLVSVPAVASHGATAGSRFIPNFVFPFQLFSSLWGYGFGTGSFLDQFPLQLGVAPLLLAIFAIALAFKPSDEHAPSTRSISGLVKLWLASSVVLVLITFEVASPLWNVLGWFASYPWQLLSFVGVLLALVAGAVVDLDPRLARPSLLAFLVGLPVIAAYGYFTPGYMDYSPSRPQIAVFNNNEIALLDYRIVGPLRHGATIRLELVWQALRPIDHDYTVFVHAVHENGETYGQTDSKPMDGTLSTLKWVPGQVISDMHTIQIDVDGPSEGYLLQVGLYYGAGGQRAIMDNGADYLELPRPEDPEPVISDQIPLASSSK